MKKDYFALLFSDRSLSLAQSGRGDTLRLYLKKDLPPGVIERGEIKTPQGLKAAVLDLIKSSKTTNHFVVVGLPEIKSFTRTFNLPALPVEELAEAVRWESEPLLPFSLEDAYLDWMVLEQSASDSRVLVVALPKKLVDDYAALLEEIGLQPVAFEITSLSLARLVPPLKTAQIILNIEPQEAVLAVIGPQGGIEVSSTINYENSRESLSEIHAAVTSAVTFYRKKMNPEKEDQTPATGVSVSQIILTGQSLIPEIIENLKKETGLPTGPLKNIRPELAVITSLAGKEVASPVDEKTINLIPPRIQGIYDRESRLKEMTNWIKVSLLALLIILLSSAAVLGQILFEKSRVEKKTVVLKKTESAESQAVEKEALFLNARAQKIISLHQPFSSKLALLNYLLDQNTSDVRLRQVVYSGESGSFLVSGIAANRASLVGFKETLEKSDLVKDIRIPLSSLEKEENADFTVSVTGS